MFTELVILYSDPVIPFSRLVESYQTWNQLSTNTFIPAFLWKWKTRNNLKNVIGKWLNIFCRIYLSYSTNATLKILQAHEKIGACFPKNAVIKRDTSAFYFCVWHNYNHERMSFFSPKDILVWTRTVYTHTHLGF